MLLIDERDTKSRSLICFAYIKQPIRMALDWCVMSLFLVRLKNSDERNETQNV